MMSDGRPRPSAFNEKSLGRGRPSYVLQWQQLSQRGGGPSGGGGREELVFAVRVAVLEERLDRLHVRLDAYTRTTPNGPELIGLIAFDHTQALLEAAPLIGRTVTTGSQHQVPA